MPVPLDKGNGGSGNEIGLKRVSTHGTGLFFPYNAKRKETSAGGKIYT